MRESSRPALAVARKEQQRGLVLTCQSSAFFPSVSVRLPVVLGLSFGPSFFGGNRRFSNEK